jgi:dephospho-CoA kinase
MPLLRVAITGGIATGKSHCLDRFARLGAETIDADLLAREAVAPGSAGLDRLVRRFGRSILGPDGELDRTKLGELVFQDAGARRDLEAIVHPAVYAAISAWFDELDRRSRADGREVVAIADIPLLFETDRHHEFEQVVVAACPPDRQLERLIARGLSREAATRRIAAQLPIEEKAGRGDFVIDTSGTFEQTDAQVDRVWTALSSLAGARR